jgi:hypothetical protein
MSVMLGPGLVVGVRDVTLWIHQLRAEWSAGMHLSSILAQRHHACMPLIHVQAMSLAWSTRQLVSQILLQNSVYLSFAIVVRHLR